METHNLVSIESSNYFLPYGTNHYKNQCLVIMNDGIHQKAASQQVLKPQLLIIRLKPYIRNYRHSFLN